jgi:DNA-binding MarR family transcriptional regulator
MPELSSHVQEILPIESFLSNILPDLNEQHARVLAMIFRLGGYTTLNLLTKLLGIAQSTVSVRVQELVDQGYLRKNPELMPITLVMLATIEDLKQALGTLSSTQRNAAKFLEKSSKLQNKQLVEKFFTHAFDVLFPQSPKLAKLITWTYMKEIISRKELYDRVRMLEQKEEKEKGFSDRVFDSIIEAHNEWFQTIRQKKETYIKPVYPLDLYSKIRMDILREKHSYYSDLLHQIEQFMNVEYESIIPHQSIAYPSEVKLKIKSCMRHYNDLKIIDNGIYPTRGDLSKNGETLLMLILKNDRLLKLNDYKIEILTQKIIDLPEIPSNVRIDQKLLKGDVLQDYRLRDFLLFEKNGCLVVPQNLKQSSYYNISPIYISTILEFFVSKWRKSDVI